MASKETLDTIEKTLDVVEDTIDTIERIPKADLNGTTKRQQVIILGVTAVVSAAAGGGLTYIWAKRHFKAKYEQIIEEEVAEAKRFYGKLHKTGEYADPSNLVKDRKDEEDSGLVGAAIEAIRVYAGEVEEPVETEQELSEESFVEQPPTKTVLEVVEETTVVTNVFDTDESDEVEELPDRNPDEPYVITEQEFYQNEPDHTQLSFTYYEGDDVLADERDIPIQDTEGTVGDDNLTRFGYGTQDKNRVHIRNERISLDFEVSRSEGKYGEEVAGFIEHSNDMFRSRRFRLDDDG